MAAGRVHHHLRHPAAGQLAQGLGIGRGAGRLEHVGDAEPVADEVEPRRGHVHHHDAGAGEPGKLDGREPDRPRADHEHRLGSSRCPAVDCVAADGERLDERVLGRREPGRGMELAGGHGEQLPQAAVAVHAERLVVFAAVGEAAGAGVAPLAVDVGLDAAAVAGSHVRDAGADGHHFDGQLMAGDPRITEERHLAEVAAVVGAADADGMHADHSLAGPRLGRLGNIDEPERLRLFELQGLHGVTPGGRRNEWPCRRG